MRIENKMYRQTLSLQKLPSSFQAWATTFLMGKFVPFIKTSGIRFEKLTREEVIVSTQNKKKVQNHIHGIHACVMALLAETASGFVFGMNTPDDKLMLLKSMQINYIKKSQGAMRAVAHLDEHTAQLILQQEKGNVVVPVTVYDESDEAPIEVTMIWAWVTKK